jgi:hypothetical protein
MRAAVMYRAGDVRIENVPDPKIEEPTDAILRVVRASICGSDLWPYNSMEASEAGQSMGHEAMICSHASASTNPWRPRSRSPAPAASSAASASLNTRRSRCRASFYKNVTIGGGPAAAPAPARAHIDDLLPDVLEGRIQPGRVFDRVVRLAEVPDHGPDLRLPRPSCLRDGRKLRHGARDGTRLRRARSQPRACGHR